MLWRFLEKFKLPYDLAIPFLGIYPKELKGGSQGNIDIPTFIAALFKTAKRWKEPQWMTINRRMHKEKVDCTHSRTLFRLLKGRQSCHMFQHG
jgi:hypothetical protein